MSTRQTHLENRKIHSTVRSSSIPRYHRRSITCYSTSVVLLAAWFTTHRHRILSDSLNRKRYAWWRHVIEKPECNSLKFTHHSFGFSVAWALLVNRVVLEEPSSSRVPSCFGYLMYGIWLNKLNQSYVGVQVECTRRRAR